MVTPLTRTFTLNSLSVLELHHVQAELVTYRDRQAVRLVEQGEPAATDPTIAILADSDFTDGVIEAELAGAPVRMPLKICAASPASPFACSHTARARFAL